MHDTITVEHRGVYRAEADKNGQWPGLYVVSQEGEKGSRKGKSTARHSELAG